MDKNKAIIIIGVIALIMGWKSYIPTSSIVGKYVNNNITPILEGPSSTQNGIDTLILLKGGVFESKTWGKGTYDISKNFMKTRINLIYTYSMGDAGFSTQIEKTMFGKTIIWLDYDLGFYFEKIEVD